MVIGDDEIGVTAAMGIQVVFAILASVAFITSASAATTTGTLNVSATVAFPCTIFATARPAGPVCQPASNPGIAVAPHAIRTLWRDAATGVTTLAIEF